MRRKYVVFTALLLLHASARAEDCETRPDWCKPGFACAPTSCVVELRTQLEEAKIDLRRALRTSHVIHGDLTCGPGVAGVVTTDLGASLVPAPLACVVGIAFNLGAIRWHRSPP